MPIYQYIKSRPEKFQKAHVATAALYRSLASDLVNSKRDNIYYDELAWHKTGRKKQKTAASLVLMTLGSAVLVWVLWPIVSFTIFTAPLFSQIISPVSDNGTSSKQASFLSPVVLAAGGDDKTTTGGVDFTNANIWFPTSPQKKVVTPVNTYTLSIPKLWIANARVVIAGDDLSTNLVHYGGTGLPGEYGTTVVFGHSVLPQFFDAKNYKTIFSTLPTLKPGDEIFITYDSIQYAYKIYDLVLTEPNDLSSLEQNFSDSYLTLITCVPPGTYWKRLNVKAKLVRP